MKNIIIIISLLMIGSFLFSQNNMIIPDVSSNAEDTISISLQVTNVDAFVAIQTDIQLPDQVTYIENSGVLTSRAQDHILSISLLDDNLLRVFIYSLSNSTFLGNSGSVLDFQIILGTIPGNYQLQLINPIIGNASSQNILTGSTNGNLTLQAPDINLDSGSLDFGEVPLLDYVDRTVTVSNAGNLPLDITRIYTDNIYFEVLGDTTMTIPAGGNNSVTIRFNSQEKGNYQNQLFFLSSDPDESTLSIQLDAIAFAVNELHVVDAVGSSGYNSDISFTINNMEAFVAYQFDLQLPSVLSYVENSVALSSRSIDHVVTANNLSDGVLRIIAYSPSNTAFTGNDGEIVSFTGYIDGIGGNYSLNLSNVIISNEMGENINSDYYSGNLTITAPDIQGASFLDMGETPVTDSLFSNYQISNTGSDPLIISNINSNTAVFWCNTSLPQTINSQQSLNFQIIFFSPNKGEFSDTFSIISNDPDENPFHFNVTADAYAPNYILIPDIYASVQDTVTVEIEVDNYEEFVAMQVDIIVPNGLNYIQDSALLTSRANGHILQVNEIAANTLRLITFSMNQLPFSGNSGAVITLDFFSALPSGNYSLVLDNGTLANANSQDILKDMVDGNLTIIQSPENVTILKTVSGFMISWDSIDIASTYKVYSSTNPISTFPDDWTLEIDNLTESQWLDDNLNPNKKFYRIIAVF